MGGGAVLPGSSCTCSLLAPHLVYFPSDSLDSDPLHEDARSSGEISLSALLAKPVLAHTLLFSSSSDQTHVYTGTLHNDRLVSVAVVLGTRKPVKLS